MSCDAKKEIHAFLRDAERAGCTVEMRGSGHYRVSRDGVVIKVLPASPSRPVRQILNTVRRRHHIGHS